MAAIVSDVGGTNSRFARMKDGVVEAGSVRRYRNDEHRFFRSALDAYLAEIGVAQASALAVAVAGPVTAGRACLTNRDWVIDMRDLRAITAGPVILINDLKALGFSLRRLRQDDSVSIVNGDGATGANGQSLVVGMGTGCNVSPVLDLDGGVRCLDAEYGHTSMPFSVMNRLRGCLGDAASAFPTVEHLFSGRGLANLHTALTGEAVHRSEAIVAAASAHADSPATRTIDLFAEMLGALTGDLAIAYLPGNGIYYAGGVSRAVLGTSSRAAFVSGYDASRPTAIATGRVPVWLVVDDFAALRGCAHALQAAQE